MIRASRLTVWYQLRDEKPALRNLSLTVETGKRVALAGANGAGKSTLLLALTGILLPQEGSLEAAGIPVRRENLRELRRRVGLVFQNPDDQLFMPTVEEDIAFGPRNLGLDEGEITARTEALTERLGIGRLKNRISHHLSGGEKRLAALAGILVMEPSLLLLDEPAAFLDPRSRRSLTDMLAGLPETMLIATHDLDMALDLCHEVIFLRDGAVAARSPVPGLLADGDFLQSVGLELPLSLRGRQRAAAAPR
jgi:cobalt/nickel transport system ATP-binding protein